MKLITFGSHSHMHVHAIKMESSFWLAICYELRWVNIYTWKVIWSFRRQNFIKQSSLQTFCYSHTCSQPRISKSLHLNNGSRHVAKKKGNDHSWYMFALIHDWLHACCFWDRWESINVWRHDCCNFLHFNLYTGNHTYNLLNSEDK